MCGMAVPQLRIDVDGWNSLDPRWRDRVDAESSLALAVEALRRTIELRDLLAESGSVETTRALMLNGVLNALYECIFRERMGPEAPLPHGTGAGIVRALQDAGVLGATEYRSVHEGA